MKRPKVPRHERAHNRARVGPLKKTLVKPRTAMLYRSAVQLFFFWLKAQRLPWPEDGDELDARVCEFGEMAWEEGETRALYANLISGIPWYEESLRQHLCSSRRLLSAWDRNEWT